MQKRIVRKTILMCVFSFFMGVMLSACGKEEEYPEKVFGIDYSQEKEIQLTV